MSGSVLHSNQAAAGAMPRDKCACSTGDSKPEDLNNADVHVMQNIYKCINKICGTEEACISVSNCIDWRRCVAAGAVNIAICSADVVRV